MKNIKRILSIILLCVWVGSSAYAQNNATEGKEFYLNFTQNSSYVAGTSGTTTQIRYVVSKTCYITVQYGDGTYLDNNVQYAPGTYTKDVDQFKCYTDIPGTGTISNNKYLKITSTENIGVYALNMRSATTDATTVLPIGALGNHYTILSNNNSNASSISVLAPTAGTIITVRNAAGTAVASDVSIPTGTVYVYSVASADFTGYTVESNNNVCVFSSVRSGSPHPGGGSDHNWEQIWPTNTAGRNYLVWSMSRAPSISSNSQSTDYIKVVALEDGTTVMKKIGSTSTNISLNKHQVNAFDTPSGVTASPYENNSAGMIELTSDKPFLVEHILGDAPCIKGISPIEQRVTNAVISPFIPSSTSQITYHRLHIIIPANSESSMQIKEVRGGVETDITLPFYTNTTNSDYVVAYKEYAQYDDVLIYMNNPGGFVAYIVGYGSAESYIITAGAGAFDLTAYFTVNGTLHQAIDGTTVCGTGTRTFEAILWGASSSTPGYLKWFINGTEEISARDQLTWSKDLAIGTYTIRMDVIDLSSTTQQYSTTFTVAEGTTPSVTISGTTMVCTGTSTTLTATPSNGGSNPSYQWKNGGTDISGATTSTYTYTPTNGDVITCVLTSSDPCASSTTATSNELTMMVNAIVAPSVVISGNTTVCTGTSVTFTAVPTNEGSNPSYQWKVNGSNVGTDSNTFTYTPENGDEITCVMISSSSCASPTTATSEPIIMSVNTVVPSATITATPNNE